MHFNTLQQWRHGHTFGTDERHTGERRTWWVIALTLVMMIVEIVAGMIYGSMALLADGWHMGTHAAALGIAAFAYLYARRHAADRRFSFGTGKVGALGGFASAVGLAVVALFVMVESVMHLVDPVPIEFDQAIGVAVVGLVVNLLSAMLLMGGLSGEHGHGHGHGHGHEPSDGLEGDHADHNLRGAYLHVLADALTSVLAIVALFAGKWLGWMWMDPTIGVVGSLVIARWSFGLLGDTSAVLLDAEISDERQQSIRRAIESDADNRIVDLHLWRVGPRHLAALISLVTHEPREPQHYKDLLIDHPDLVHITVEVYPCADDECEPNLLAQGGA